MLTMPEMILTMPTMKETIWTTATGIMMAKLRGATEIKLVVYALKLRFKLIF
jgi:hypothetical protein